MVHQHTDFTEQADLKKSSHLIFKYALSNLFDYYSCVVKRNHLKPLMHNVAKWSDTLKESCSIWCKILKVCLTILRNIWKYTDQLKSRIPSPLSREKVMKGNPHRKKVIAWIQLSSAGEEPVFPDRIHVFLPCVLIFVK